MAAPVLARTMQRAEWDYDDQQMMADAISLESRALAAIRLHQPVLYRSEKPKQPFQLRLPGL